MPIGLGEPIHLMDDTETSEPPEPCPGETALPGVTIDLIDDASRLTPEQRGWVVERAHRALAPIDASGEARVKIVGDSEMALAHELHKSVPGTTDVLTFDLEAGDDRVVDADILVCADEARRQARRLGHSPEREVVLYIVHAVLHCVGYDDTDEAGSAKMHAREDELLEAAGIGATFAPGGGGNAS